MATIPALVEFPTTDAMRITWANMNTGDVGEAVSSMHEYADRSVIAIDAGGGGFGGGSITLQGSPNHIKDAATAFWETIHSPSETPIIITANGWRAVLEYVESIRPAASAAIANVTVILICKRMRR
jgi:hypothetical protein